MAMALSSAFRERLEQMDQTRLQRLSLLQAENELQANKSLVLTSKLATIRYMEQRCLLLDRKIASQNFKISSLKSEIARIDADYQKTLQQLRVLRIEVAELEELEREKERFYRLKREEMMEFRENVERFVADRRLQVEELRRSLNELQSSFTKLQGTDCSLSNSEIAAAEMKRCELLTVKENVERNLASNYRIRAQLQKELQNMFSTQNQQ